jgi:predicted nucleic acid-binding protein
LIRAELEKGGHLQSLACFESGQVHEHQLTFEELLEVSGLEREVGSKAKFNDCSVIFLAIKLNAMLLSGDKPLRKAGRARAIEVHGTLWILDQLVERGLLSPGIAANKLEYLRSLDRFFPDAECQSRLIRWQA